MGEIHQKATGMHQITNGLRRTKDKQTRTNKSAAKGQQNKKVNLKIPESNEEAIKKEQKEINRNKNGG